MTVWRGFCSKWSESTPSAVEFPALADNSGDARHLFLFPRNTPTILMINPANQYRSTLDKFRQMAASFNRVNKSVRRRPRCLASGLNLWRRPPHCGCQPWYFFPPSQTAPGTHITPPRWAELSEVYDFYMIQNAALNKTKMFSGISNWNVVFYNILRFRMVNNFIIHIDRL